MENRDLEKLPDAERFVYFIQEIISHKGVWLLKAHDGLYAMVEDDHSQTYLPVWPDSASAKEFTTGDWEEYVPELMGLFEFLDWLQELKGDDVLIGVFPNSKMQSLAADPLELKKQILQGTKG
jgi:hypothetical protein